MPQAKKLLQIVVVIVHFDIDDEFVLCMNSHIMGCQWKHMMLTLDFCDLTFVQNGKLETQGTPSRLTAQYRSNKLMWVKKDLGRNFQGENRSFDETWAI